MCSEYAPQALANTAWACSTRLEPNGPLLDSISSASIRTRTDSYKSQEIANTAWACAVLWRVDFPLLESLASAAIARITHFVPPQLAGTAWA